MKKLLILPVALAALLAGGAVRVVQDQCGPFTDVTPAFCPYILELYYLGVTAGTSATTFSPDDPLTRGQGSVFVAKGLNQALARSSRRAALGQWWTTKTQNALGSTTVGANPVFTVADGADVWVTFSEHVLRVRASDARILETWTGATQLNGAIVAAMGQVFVTGYSAGGNHWAIFRIDPSQSDTTMADVATIPSPISIAFDGARLWTANGDSRSISITTPGPTLPWSTTTVNPPDLGETFYLTFDGAHMWVTATNQQFVEFDEAGNILRSVPLDFGSNLGKPVFDGANFWIPDFGHNAVIVVRASDGTVVTTLTAAEMVTPTIAAFDGTRVLVSCTDGVFLWNAADLTPIGFTPTGAASSPYGSSSDGINFWIPLEGIDQLVRF
ncbi:MAG TPA: S-layer homology domain-containing protein [Thermoanaerobaculia bacterium]